MVYPPISTPHWDGGQYKVPYTMPSTPTQYSFRILWSTPIPPIPGPGGVTGKSEVELRIMAFPHTTCRKARFIGDPSRPPSKRSLYRPDSADSNSPSRCETWGRPLAPADRTDQTPLTERSCQLVDSAYRERSQFNVESSTTEGVTGQDDVSGRAERGRVVQSDDLLTIVGVRT